MMEECGKNSLSWQFDPGEPHGFAPFIGVLPSVPHSEAVELLADQNPELRDAMKQLYELSKKVEKVIRRPETAIQDTVRALSTYETNFVECADRLTRLLRLGITSCQVVMVDRYCEFSLSGSHIPLMAVTEHDADAYGSEELITLDLEQLGLRYEPSAEWDVVFLRINEDQCLVRAVYLGANTSSEQSVTEFNAIKDAVLEGYWPTHRERFFGVAQKHGNRVKLRSATTSEWGNLHPARAAWNAEFLKTRREITENIAASFAAVITEGQSCRMTFENQRRRITPQRGDLTNIIGQADDCLIAHLSDLGHCLRSASRNDLLLLVKLLNGQSPVELPVSGRVRSTGNDQNDEYTRAKILTNLKRSGVMKALEGNGTSFERRHFGTSGRVRGEAHG